MREPNEYQDSDLYIKEDLNSTECRRNTGEESGGEIADNFQTALDEKL